MPVGTYFAEPLNLIIATGVLGLVVGSFLNVVILRLPQMMEQEWREQCAELFGCNTNLPTSEKISLNLPRSHCPHCKNTVRALDNIPVLSYLILRGRCRSCGQSISLRYPFVELLCAIISMLVAWRFGFGWPLAGALILSWALLALGGIDFDTQYLPDNITLPLLWLGLFCNLFGLYVDLISAVIGAISGYMLFWLIYQLFKLFTGKEGMGFGDFKLFAALGAWLGWQALPAILLLSSLSAAILGIMLIAWRGRDKAQPLSFGPYLAIAGWIMLVWRDEIARHDWLWLNLTY